MREYVYDLGKSCKFYREKNLINSNHIILKLIFKIIIKYIIIKVKRQVIRGNHL